MWRGDGRKETTKLIYSTSPLKLSYLVVISLLQHLDKLHDEKMAKNICLS